MRNRIITFLFISVFNIEAAMAQFLEAARLGFLIQAEKEAERQARNEKFMLYGGIALAVLVIILIVWRMGANKKKNNSDVAQKVLANGQTTNLEQGTIEAKSAIALTADNKSLQTNLTKNQHIATREQTRDCPFCGQTIKSLAKLCRFCKSSVEPIVVNELKAALSTVQNIASNVSNDIKSSSKVEEPLPQSGIESQDAKSDNFAGSKPLSEVAKTSQAESDLTSIKVSKNSDRKFPSRNITIGFVATLGIAVLVAAYSHFKSNVNTIEVKRPLGDGTIYEGTWANTGSDVNSGFPSGKGKLIFKSGRSDEGVFTKGGLRGRVTRTLSNGETLTGEYKKVGDSQEIYMFFSDKNMPSENLFEFINLAVDERFDCESENIGESERNTSCRYFKDVMKRLNDRNWCLGQLREDPKFYEWHRCASDSLRLNNFVLRKPTNNGQGEQWRNNPKKIVVAKSGESLTDVSKRIIGKPVASLGLPLDEYSSTHQSGPMFLTGNFQKPERPIFEVSQSCSVDKALPLGELFGDLDCRKENLPRLVALAKDLSSGISEVCHGEAYDPSQRTIGYVNRRKGIYWMTGEEIFSVGIFRDFVGIEGGFGPCDLKARAEFQKAELRRTTGQLPGQAQPLQNQQNETRRAQSFSEAPSTATPAGLSFALGVVIRNREFLSENVMNITRRVHNDWKESATPAMHSKFGDGINQGGEAWITQADIEKYANAVMAYDAKKTSESRQPRSVTPPPMRNWQSVGYTDAREFFLDWYSKPMYGDQAAIPVLYEEKTLQTLSSGQQYLSSVHTMQIDCIAHSSRDVEVRYFSGKTESGNIVFEQSTSTKWTNIAQGTLGALVEKRICAQPQQAPKSTQTLTYPHGTYVGEVLSGKAHGLGTYTAARSGTVYTGQFIGDTFSGVGTMTWTDGSKFVGKWQNDVGISGTMTYANGSTTSGVVRSGVFTPSASQSNAQQSTIVWNHNNSKMKIDMVNNTINIYYIQPRQAMLDAGAKPNDLLVNGTIQSNQITGTARIFAGRCGQFTYPVTGNIFNNGREISLNGQAPVVNLSNCQVTKYVPDPLSFNVIQANTQSNSQSSKPQTNNQPQTQSPPSQSQANPDVRINNTNGDVYFGQVIDGKPNGQGTFAWASGGRYVGEFKNGLRNGQGTLTFREGSSYVGEFKDDKYNGQGTLTLKDISRYVGGWKDGKKNGQGTSTSSTSSYVGEFKYDVYNGRGTLTSKDFSSYVGEFKNGEKNGQGTLTVNNSFSYVGEFKDGKMNGRGTLTDKDGTKIVGLFKDGFPVGPQTNSQPPQSQANTEVEKLQSEIIKIQKEIESLQKERLSLSDVNDASSVSKESLAVGNVNDVVKLRQTLKELDTIRDQMSQELASEYLLTATLKPQ